MRQRGAKMIGKKGTEEMRISFQDFNSLSEIMYV